MRGRKPVKVETKRTAFNMSVSPQTRDTLNKIREETGLCPGRAVDYLVNKYEAVLYILGK